MDHTNHGTGPQDSGASSIGERRRVLRTLGAGGVLTGAPGLALATTSRPYCKKDSKNFHATASAVGSMMGSMTGTTPSMYGHPVAHYQPQSNWGSGWNTGVGGHSLTWDTCGNKAAPDATRIRFWALFGLANPNNTSINIGRSCAFLIQDYPSSEESIWVVAVLNACKVGSRFPYTPRQVIDLYSNRNPLIGGREDLTLRSKAIVLFRDYLSLGMT